jgi:hypothetical protein
MSATQQPPPTDSRGFSFFTATGTTSFDNVLYKIKRASGRAHCRFCREILKKNTTDVHVGNISSTAEFHSHPECFKKFTETLLQVIFDFERKEQKL